MYFSQFKLANKTIFTTTIIAAFSMSLASPACSAANPCLTNSNKSAAQLESCIKLENLVQHLKTFQQHADHNTTIPGTRFMGTQGYEASSEYVIDQLKQAGYQVTVQPMPYTLSYITKPNVFEQVQPTQQTFVDDKDYAPFVKSGEGEVTAQVQTVANTGCELADYENFHKGNIALLPLGDCDRAKIIDLAVAAGASAVILTNYTDGVFYAGVKYSPVPALLVSSKVGNQLRADIDAHVAPTMHIKFTAKQLKTNSVNIIAESKTGDANHVVMVGAHLDSSIGNAGMNDNASAAASVLEIALQMQHVNPVNKLRFAFWTGEEMGLLGSTYYINQLNNAEKAKIALYLNYEILGAPNGARLIMSYKKDVTPTGSEKITKTYTDYFKSRGLKYYAFDPTMGNAGRRSDMLAFMESNIPVGYLVTGAELPWNPLLSAIFTDLPNRTNGLAMHPCYHKACDKLTMVDGQMKDPNFDFDLYLQMSKAAAFAVYTYAMQLN